MTFQSIAGPRFLPGVFMATALVCGCAGSGANAGAESWLRGEAILEEPAPMPGVPATLESVVSKALSKEVDGRYQSAIDMANDLAEFSGDTVLQTAVRPVIAATARS